MSNEENSGVVEQTAPGNPQSTGKKAGRPLGSGYTDEQYLKWLDDMAPFLKMGDTLWSAMDSAGLLKHKDAIYEKYRLGDFFSEKVDTLQAYPAKLVKNVLVNTVVNVHDKMKTDKPISEDEMKNVRFMAEKYRPAQVYFVTRQEQAQSDDKDVGKILDNLETDYDDIRRQAQKQMVANQSPVQNQGQSGATGNIQAESGTAQTSH